ncbi:Copper homeostasis protein CutC [Aquisphaera giovannonii]|uniref:PF03932 family protein CutC n=1 Tax=Aquisphaera giovannonii TaxID=406548 RepID=A0A5B9W2P7_9BACT|nr:copper homeostasis protein CutC [Aquisphaera giovannonii]QEH34866.1 Copper homeostasis protein CutC [Aquisphaera giovannonii]
MSRRTLVEICAGSLEAALDAGRGGADRVELCQDLAVGGVTPSAGDIAVACGTLDVPVHVLVRPRAGDFLPSEAEFQAMRHDVAASAALGASGVVLGILLPDGTIDRERTARLVDLARPLSVTFHKAFDEVPDHLEALETLIALGVDRVLTSGGRPSALEGAGMLRRLVEAARGRIAILAGGRIAATQLETILEGTGVREAHLGSAVARTVESAMRPRPEHGLDPRRPGIDPEKVRDIVGRVARWDRLARD